MLIRITLAACILGLLVAAAAPRDQICGVWYNQEGDAKLEISQNDQTFEAKIVWLKEPEENGQPKIDKNNPDEGLRSRPVLGLILLHDLRKSDDPNFYKGGEIYDPKNGRTYDCRITFEGKTLKLRGFVLGMPFLGRTAIWSRAE